MNKRIIKNKLLNKEWNSILMEWNTLPKWDDLKADWELKADWDLSIKDDYLFNFNNGQKKWDDLK